MQYYYKYTLILSGLALGLALTTGPALAGGFSSMQKDYEEYTGSEFLNENLTARKPAPRDELPQVEESTRALSAVREELTGRKSAGEAALENVITNNGIFEPDERLWQRVKTGADGKDLEGLLKVDYTLDTILAVGLKNNQDIHKSLSHARASLEKYDQVSNLDEILGQYAVFTKNLEINVGKPRHLKPVQMDFPFPAVLALKGDIVDREALISRLKLEKTVRDVITEIRETYYETVYLDQAVQITTEVLVLLRRLKKAVDTVYTTGRSTLSDVVKIEMEIDRLENELVSTLEKRKVMQVKLNKLLDLPEGFTPPPPVREPEPVILDYSAEALFRAGEAERSEIKIKLATLDRMRLLIEMAEKRFYPDFSPGMSLFENRVIKQVGTGAELPAFPTRPNVRGANWFGTNDAYIREVRQKYRALEKEIAELKNKTVTEIKSAAYRYENAERERVLFEKKLVPKSTLTVEITESMYITGKVDYMDLISSQQMYLDFSLKLKKSVKDMNTAAARIERLAGGRVEQRQAGSE